MQVVATAGHVDHGKSSLVFALTGMQPDRWVEERRRGLTIDLGFAWARLPSGTTMAFVDVPGHERFIGNMLAGVGAVPAVMFVVAADEGWSAQSAEHLDAIDTFRVQDGLLVVTKCDLADPEPARRQAMAQLAKTSLGRVDTCCVSAVTGTGLDSLGNALDRLASRLDVPPNDAPVRLWIDRAFTVAGAGTVVTGTLPAGAVRVGDELDLAPAGRRVTVRGLQSLERPCVEVAGPARVAINLRRVATGELARGDALLTPDAWVTTTEVDVLVEAELPREIRCHVGAAAVTARVRQLGPGLARLRLASALPFHVGDRILLRVPGDRRIRGAAVLDPRPPALGRRGAAAGRARQLRADADLSPPVGQVRMRGLVRTGELAALGVAVPYPPVVGDWVADPDHWAALQERLRAVVDEHARRRPDLPGLAAEEARRVLDLPDPVLVHALAVPPLAMHGGRVTRSGARDVLPDRIRTAVDAVLAELAENPYAAPTAGRLLELGLDAKALAVAARAGAILRLGDLVCLAPDAARRAAAALRLLPQPFTVGEARAALATSRRVVVPLLECLDQRGFTERLDSKGLRRVTRDQARDQ